MTPQERQMIDELFDKLAKLETMPRDASAERAIAEASQRAPHALYALTQTVLVQDEALKQAEARIRELSGEAEAPASGGFLDSMRNALGGGRGSVPSVRAGGASDSRWNTGGALAPAQPASPFNAAPQAQAPGGGPSFLGTAAATAAGVIGGSLLFNALGGMFGGHHSGSAMADVPRDQGSSNPWSGSDNAAGGDLSRDAGLNDVGGDRRAGLFDDDNSSGDQFDTADNGDFGGDFGGDGGGDA
ncbi:DUF2076 domain-containing protein [Undibacter mobilis]|uniref:DUF2076 domain-containing protein n=1 Tax=Undibacter mobilis TaxID=2292256 RepID=A0A371BBH4_9BRAD|nr:DUF2076 domain-containing protein [Undibacter mobilis]RDV04900.1 DUF2076 domain-containing protein [Undibacter mobilis]